jgi:hypothetical protein
MQTIREIAGAIAGFVVKLIIANLLIILYPVLVFIVPLWAIHTGDSGTIRVVSFFYLMFGPMCAGFWFLYANFFPKYYAARKRGETLDTWNVAFHVGATGKMFAGIVLSYLCTFAMASQVSMVKSPLAWFALIGIAQNFPTLLMILWSNRDKSSACVCNGRACFDPNCHGTIRKGFCSECNLNATVVA